MEESQVQKISIYGPTLASILQRFSSATGDADGLLFGQVSHITPTLSDDDHSATSSTLVATVTSFFVSGTINSFYNSSGELNLVSLQNLVSSPGKHPDNLLGWISCRRRTPLRPSMREFSVTSNLSRTFLNSSIFILFSNPLINSLIHTHEYRAYQFSKITNSFEPKQIDVVNIGPAFRSHYSSFCPNSIFPMLPCELRGSLAMVEDSTGSKDESLNHAKRVAKDQKELDNWALGFEVGKLNRMLGSEAANYTENVEKLYENMLAKLEGLARLVEKSSALVLEQENRNMKLRYRVA
ncbi:hypothetical protein RJ641_028580, partial [Dillenia turbinata]